MLRNNSGTHIHGIRSDHVMLQQSVTDSVPDSYNILDLEDHEGTQLFSVHTDGTVYGSKVSTSAISGTLVKRGASSTSIGQLHTDKLNIQGSAPELEINDGLSTGTSIKFHVAATGEVTGELVSSANVDDSLVKRNDSNGCFINNLHADNLTVTSGIELDDESENEVGLTSQAKGDKSVKKPASFRYVFSPRSITSPRLCSARFLAF